MVSAVLLIAIPCLLMVLPYVPGRFDASAVTLSFVARVAAYVSLLLVPIGLGELLAGGRSPWWRRATIAVAALVAFVAAAAAATANQLAVGLLLGAGAAPVLRALHRRLRTSDGHGDPSRVLRASLVAVPLLLLAFQSLVLPRAMEWSRDRAIRHSAVLIAEIESFRDRRGHYPLSLQSLNRDVPTGVVGIERFHYEPSGDAYNVFFVRPHADLDAREVVMFNPRDEHRFTSHELDILQYDGEQLDRRRGDRRRTPLAHPHWISILFD